MKKPMGPITRRKHEARNSELERLHRLCAEEAVREREREKKLNDEITALLRPARKEAQR
jgi:hypothetical protein